MRMVKDIELKHKFCMWKVGDKISSTYLNKHYSSFYIIDKEEPIHGTWWGDRVITKTFYCNFMRKHMMCVTGTNQHVRIENK